MPASVECFILMKVILLKAVFFSKSQNKQIKKKKKKKTNRKTKTKLKENKWI